MKLTITFGRDTDDDYSIDITLTLGVRQYTLGLFLMATDHTPEPEPAPYVFIEEPDLTGVTMKDMGWSDSSKTNRPEEPFKS